MSEQGSTTEPPDGGPALVLSAAVTVLAAGGAVVFAVPALGVRSGSGDGFGDLLPLFLMLATAPLMLIGLVLVLTAAVGRVWGVAVAATGVLALGALMTIPVLMFGKPLTTTVSVCEFVAALAALVMVGVITAGVPTPPPRRGPTSS